MEKVVPGEQDAFRAICKVIVGRSTWREFQLHAGLQDACAAGVGDHSFGKYVGVPLRKSAVLLLALVCFEFDVLDAILWFAWNLLVCHAKVVAVLVFTMVLLVIATARACLFVLVESARFVVLACRFVLVKSARFVMAILTSRYTIAGVLIVLAFSLVTGALTGAACVVHGWDFFRMHNDDEDAVGEAASLPFMGFVFCMGWLAATVGRVCPRARVSDLRSRILRGVNLSENLGSAFFLCVVTVPPPTAGGGCSCPTRILEAAFVWWSDDVTKLLLCYNLAIAVEVVLVLRSNPVEISGTLLAIDVLQLIMDAMSIVAIQGYGGSTAAMAFFMKMIASLGTNDKVQDCLVQRVQGEDDRYEAIA